MPGTGLGWQHAFRLIHAHLQAGGALPIRPDEVIVQGEDLSTRTRVQQA